MEIRDLADGLWIWRLPHPGWKAGEGWDPEVTCTCVTTRGETLLVDPLLPPLVRTDFWERLDDSPPSAVVILKPDHVRDVDFFASTFGIPAFGPDRFLRDDVPKTDLIPIWPGSELPGGNMALFDGRDRNETPLWIPDHRTLVFADCLTAPEGTLRVWSTPWHEDRVLPALKHLLTLPFERVIVSHGDPVHSRADFVAALSRPPWSH